MSETPSHTWFKKMEQLLPHIKRHLHVECVLWLSDFGLNILSKIQIFPVFFSLSSLDFWFFPQDNYSKIIPVKTKIICFLFTVCLRWVGVVVR